MKFKFEQLEIFQSKERNIKAITCPVDIINISINIDIKT